MNEGFATHAKWLWSEHEDLGPVQENFDFVYSLVPPDDPFWSLRSAILGPSRYSTRPCYWRGGTTLHQLRLAIGDDDFFRLVRTWARSHTGGNGTTAQFIALAERISGQDLVALFQTWLYIADPAGIVRRPGLGSYGVGPTGTHPGGSAGNGQADGDRRQAVAALRATMPSTPTPSGVVVEVLLFPGPQGQQSAPFEFIADPHLALGRCRDIGTEISGELFVE